MAPASLLERAKVLQSAAGRLGDKDDQIQRDEKTHNALRKLILALDDLEAVKKTMVRAVLEGVPVSNPPSWSDGLQGFREHLGRGRPSPQAINAAVTKVSKTTAAAQAVLSNAWLEWTAGHMASVQIERLPLLPPDVRTDTGDRHKRLQVIARSEPNVGLILEFINTLSIVNDRLAEATASTEVHNALDKVDAGLALSAFTEAELGALRSESTLADQIVLRRRA